ncbi:LIM domain only protein 7 isoform X5 [Cynoglossus semilaevis]|uniref:LIM domain only protein 7 isoform X5 n=1 Tax=Cynoglossus semilaevis TaxID=244447 RepID=UPI0007DCADB4|nr:LIM domain only protein 7 isoform X5 [Cynoglossus semilaevis]
MEWREQSAVGCQEAFMEAQRWIEAVTKKNFGSQDFRSALENGVLLCDLVNRIRPGLIKRVNRLPTPIAGLDNLNVFLRACGRLGLKEAQLFHPGDLQDLSTRVTVKDQETDRRLKNVLITIYWLGRRAQCDSFYDGPYLNFKAFEGLLGTALYKALHESATQKGSSVRDSGFGDSWYSEREEICQLREVGGEGGRSSCSSGGSGSGHRRDDSLDSLDSLGSRPHSISSDTTLKGSSEGCCSDPEADSEHRMADSKDNISYRRSAVIAPKTTTQFNQFLPTKDKSSGYIPPPLRKKRAERNEDNRRSWANPIYTEEDGTLTRNNQTEESTDDGSKSTSDLPVNPSILRQLSYEEMEKFREQQKANDDVWEDALSKWKTRRKSVNSDIVKKKEEREKIEQITFGNSRRSKTFKEMQEERESKATGSRLASLSYTDNDDVFERPVISPRTRTLPARSYTIDTSYFSSEPSLKEEEPPTAAPARGRAASPQPTQTVNAVDSRTETNITTTTNTSITPGLITSTRRSQLAAAAPPERRLLSEDKKTTRTEEVTKIVTDSFSSVQRVSEPRRSMWAKQTELEAPSSGAFSKQQQQIKPSPPLSSMEAKPPAVSQVSASLPRSYQRSDSARITSVIAPKPFGTQSSRLSSLSRASTMDDSYKRVNGDVNTSKKTSVPSRYHAFMTSEDEAQSSSAHSSEDEEEEEEEQQQWNGSGVKSVTSTQTVVSTQSVKSAAPVTAAPDTQNKQENCCEMRISLNQKPNSSKDFGFVAAWDSTGAQVTSVQPGSQAAMCQLQVGDEVLSVNKQQVADMSYTDWKNCMEAALQEGSLVMDILHHGPNSSPEILTTKPSLDFTSRISTETLQPKELSAKPAVDLASNGVNANFYEQSVTMRNKESEPISLKNLKRRSEFFEQGGPETTVPDIPVPSLTHSSSRWSWDPEEERKRQEKWQKEQERVLQEKYKRDQEKLQEEWQKAQEEISKSEDHQEFTRKNSQMSRLQPSVSTLWEEEERRRKQEEQEVLRRMEERRIREEEERERLRQEEEERRLRREMEEKREHQRQEEERRRREEEEQELQRLQEEKKRKEEEERKRKEEEERKRMEEEVRKRKEKEERMRREAQAEELRWQRRREEEKKRQEALEQLRREREKAFQQQEQWSAGYRVQPTLSYTDRAKSKSSPQLDEEDRPQRRGVHVQTGGMAHWLLEEQLKIAADREAQSQRAASELELERRNILNAMRYREPERVSSGGFDEKKSLSQAELERQQILNEMKKKTSLLTDNSWIRQSSCSTTYSKETDIPPMRRGESLDNLDRHSWRSSWTPRSNSYAPSYSRPHSALSGSASFYSSTGGGPGLQGPKSSTLPPFYSMGFLQGGAGTHSTPWSQQMSPPLSPERLSESGLQQRNRSVSGKKVCTFCDTPLGKGAAMIIESLGLCYHLSCFKCIDCKSDLGGSEAGAEVRIRNKQLYCNSCYMRFKTGQPTEM